MEWSDTIQAYGNTDEGRETLGVWVPQEEAEELMSTMRTIYDIIPPSKSVGGGFAYAVWKQTHDMAKKTLKKMGAI